MPVLAAPVLGFALGAGLFWSAARQLARPIRPVASPAVLIAAVLGSCVYAPATALLLSAEPDWAYAYLLPASRFPRWLGPSLVLASGLMVPLGFAASLWVSRGRSRIIPLMFWLPLGLGLLPLLLTLPRLSVQATFEQYHGNFGTQPVVGGPLGYLLLWYACGIFLSLWLARRCLSFLALGGAEEG